MIILFETNMEKESSNLPPIMIIFLMDDIEIFSLQHVVYFYREHMHSSCMD